MARKIQVGDQEFTIPTFNYGGFIIAIVFLVIWAGLSSFYIVGPDEEGVVRRFGKWVRTEESGLNFKFPYPIEEVDLPKVTQVKEISVGSIIQEAKMLTGDENILLVEVKVQYKIKNARDYLFNLRNVEETIKDATESALRQIIGSNPIDDPLTEKKDEEVGSGHQVIHKKDGRLHIYVRQDKYKGELKSKNWVGRLYIDGKQKISSSGTPRL